MSLRLARLPAYVNLSRLMMRYSGYLFTKSLTTCEPMKPAPPVITIFFILINVYIRIQITRIIQEKL
ncbi:Uncharacterised protein [Segatella copri]|nr:Uncharacterised protein [Segatella copri]